MNVVCRYATKMAIFGAFEFKVVSLNADTVTESANAVNNSLGSIRHVTTTESFEAKQGVPAHLLTNPPNPFFLLD